MPQTDWEAVEELLRPHYNDPLDDWQSARRVARTTRHLAQGLKPFNPDRARLLALFYGLGEQSSHPNQRRKWARPLLNAGVTLEIQMWLWISLQRYRTAPETEEEYAVRDAWRMQNVGAVGIARVMLQAGRGGGTMGDALDVLRKELNDVSFLTPAGRRLGIRRIVVTRRFLKELEEE